jgi:glutamyl-tRNA synthetase
VSQIRTRFAPSPTGSLHIGSARTALFNWAYARRHGGTYVLRVEDTDRERSTAESERGLLEALEWLGLDWDEGPLRQTERGDRHASVIEELLAKGLAYRCVCPAEELRERREKTIADGRSWVYDRRCRDLALGPDCGKHAVRLHVDDDAHLEWDDLVFGPSGQLGAEIGDMIIRRSDGGPLYHLAVVVDDQDMGITHVIRGADHHSNTPFQLAIYRAIGATPPAFAHVPLIVGESGKKLSKRRDVVSIQQYREDGYLPEALCNWLVRLGWSHGDDEVFGLDDIGRLFDLDAVGRSSARADSGKLQWLNQHYLRGLSPERLAAALDPYIERAPDGPAVDCPQFSHLVDLLIERSKTLPELAAQTDWYFASQLEYEAKAAKKHLVPDRVAPLKSLQHALAELEDWSPAALEDAFQAVRSAHDDLPMGKLAQPVRVALTGRQQSPGIFDVLWVLGKARSTERIGAAVAAIEAGEA